MLALRKDSRTAERNLWRNNTYQIIIFTLVRKQQSFSDFTFGNHDFNLNLCNWFVFGMQGLFSLIAVRICEQHTLFFLEIMKYLTWVLGFVRRMLSWDGKEQGLNKWMKYKKDDYLIITETKLFIHIYVFCVITRLGEKE